MPNKKKKPTTTKKTTKKTTTKKPKKSPHVEVEEEIDEQLLTTAMLGGNNREKMPGQRERTDGQRTEAAMLQPLVKLVTDLEKCGGSEVDANPDYAF
jgi:hypothetical protein